MERTARLNRAIGTLGVRLAIGLLSFELGVHKIFVSGLDATQRFFEPFRVWFPEWLLWGVNVYTSGVELVGGAMLLLGLKRDWALYAIGSVLLIAAFGHGLERAVWDIQQMVFRLGLIATLLFLPAEWDVVRLDTLLKRKPASSVS
jgi:putative oxidoreductase